jgi:hypothetical protein
LNWSNRSGLCGLWGRLRGAFLGKHEVIVVVVVIEEVGFGWIGGFIGWGWWVDCWFCLRELLLVVVE